MSWQPAVSGKRQLTWARLNRCRLVDSARHRRADRTRLCSLSIVLDRGAECRLVAIVHDLIKTKREYVAEIEGTKEREREGRKLARGQLQRPNCAERIPGRIAFGGVSRTMVMQHETEQLCTLFHYFHAAQSKLRVSSSKRKHNHARKLYHSAIAYF